MKNFKFLMIALVAMLGLTACEKDCGHDFIEVDYSRALVGTWTLVNGDFAEAWVVKEDGSVEVTGVLEGEYYETKGTVKVKNNKMSYKFDNGDEFEGIFDIIPGQCFSTIFAWDYESDERMVYQYCANDLSDEIIGMWVCNDGLTDGITVMSYSANGKSTMTTANALGTNNPLVNKESDYVVVGDLVFMSLPSADVAGGKPKYTAARMIYAPNGTSAGDIMTHKKSVPSGDGLKESVMSFLRIKQNLELPGMKYDYSKTFVTNVKGLDKDIDVMGYTFNFAKMDGVMLDKMLKTLLFTVEFPDANTIKYSCHYSSTAEPAVVEATIAVDGNKMTIGISEEYPGLKDVDMYTFQDKDNTQMHMYMPTYSFINFFGNMQVIMMSQLGMIDATDAAAVQAIYDSIDAAVEIINLSLVMTKASKAI